MRWIVIFSLLLLSKCLILAFGNISIQNHDSSIYKKSNCGKTLNSMYYATCRQRVCGQNKDNLCLHAARTLIWRSCVFNRGPMTMPETGLEYYSPMSDTHPFKVLELLLMSWLVESGVIDKGDMQNVQCWGGSRNEFGNPIHTILIAMQCWCDNINNMRIKYNNKNLWFLSTVSTPLRWQTATHSPQNNRFIRAGAVPINNPRQEDNSASYCNSRFSNINATKSKIYRLQL